MKAQTKSVGVRIPRATYEAMEKEISEGKFSSYSDMLLCLLRDYFLREEMKKVQISELSGFFRSDEGKKLISELVDQEIYRRAVESTMDNK